MAHDRSASVDFAAVEKRAAALLPPAHPPGAALRLICELLQAEVPHYDWVGCYFAVPEQRLLALGPFAGEPTEHVRIPYGRGICGQSAETEDTFVVPDVAAAENYLSCSVDTKAEIVVPVFLNGNYVAQIDIDSHTHNPFGPEDEPFLKRLAEMVAPYVPQVFNPASGRYT